MESLESQNAYSSMAAQGGGLVGEVEMLAEGRICIQPCCKTFNAAEARNPERLFSSG
jgi:hypothetical protein